MNLKFHKALQSSLQATSFGGVHVHDREDTRAL
jgi:hypothetical protein